VKAVEQGRPFDVEKTSVKVDPKVHASSSASNHPIQEFVAAKPKLKKRMSIYEVSYAFQDLWGLA
jgi:hypothetical protein